MEVLGSHLLLELKDCNSELLNDLSYIRKAMIETAQEVGATIVGESFHHFSPQGVTGILAIAESHISIHTWPEYGYAAADIFSCGTSFRPREAASKLAESLECRNPEIKEIARGLAIQEAVGL
ncbi:MAG: adenosylmethionine decarboxylase [SAR202 cluster bacterium]|nr:adenosylmethionine decarboxylase [Chloroflexota bacterium]MQG48229.1 adenosylmethionine decarboxylase [SAR202 cluster bacterium]PKB74787.1 MAG: adenosylmethionine decarboxylase [SAR202 cluster bacterium Io17-Chloro-G8]MBC50644.1 adenosylmethionine decarboxylase [Chloroflexota bacterium]MBU18296.1 adenosylmethionine decarboxylase [Chloroflexota bacterium]